MCESLRTFPVGQPFVNPGLTSGLWNFTFHKCSSQGCCRNLTHNKCSFDKAFLKYLWQLQQVTQLLKCLGEKITQGPMRLIHKALQRPHCARSVHWFRTHPLRVFVETSKALSPLRKHIISNKKNTKIPHLEPGFFFASSRTPHLKKSSSQKTSRRKSPFCKSSTAA